MGKTIIWIECLNCGDSQNKETMSKYQLFHKICSKCLRGKAAMIR